MNEGRCDERLNAKVEESTCLTYTGRVAQQNELETPKTGSGRRLFRN
jgi:hypothetical protein